MGPSTLIPQDILPMRDITIRDINTHIEKRAAYPEAFMDKEILMEQFLAEITNPQATH